VAVIQNALIGRLANYGASIQAAVGREGPYLTGAEA
jgi:hypothetical protein